MSVPNVAIACARLAGAGNGWRWWIVSRRNPAYGAFSHAYLRHVLSYAIEPEMIKAHPIEGERRQGLSPRGIVC